jgi:hypothetical protein
MDVYEDLAQLLKEEDIWKRVKREDDQQRLERLERFERRYVAAVSDKDSLKSHRKERRSREEKRGSRNVFYGKAEMCANCFVLETDMDGKQTAHVLFIVSSDYLLQS